MDIGEEQVDRALAAQLPIRISYRGQRTFVCYECLKECDTLYDFHEMGSRLCVHCFRILRNQFNAIERIRHGLEPGRDTGRKGDPTV